MGADARVMEGVALKRVEVGGTTVDIGVMVETSGATDDVTLVDTGAAAV